MPVTGGKKPSRFRMGDRNIEIVTILDRWLAPDHRYFKVQGDDGALYILRHDIESWYWELTFLSNLHRIPVSNSTV